MASDDVNLYYVSYGSNIFLPRFLTYLKGGRIPGCARDHAACIDPSEPTHDFTTQLPYRLHFRRSSSTWSNGGAAFLDTRSVETDEAQHSIVRCYKISLTQFNHVVNEENGGYLPEALTISSFKELISGGIGAHKVVGRGWYANLAYVGDRDGVPMLTFTCHFDGHSVPENPPSIQYFGVIYAGLIQAGYTAAHAYEYLKLRAHSDFPHEDVEHYHRSTYALPAHTADRGDSLA